MFMTFNLLYPCPSTCSNCFRTPGRLLTEFGSLKLNSTKVLDLYNYAASDYANTREKFGISRYDILIVIEGFSVGGETNIGIVPSNPTGQISIVRPVIYDGQPSKLTVTVWMNYTV